MDVDNGRLSFKVTLDNSQLASDGAKSINIFKGIGDAATAQGARLDNVFKQAGKSASLFGNDISSLQQNILALASIATLGRLGKEIITVRGEFQQLGIAFETMLGSKEKADKLMQEAITFSQKTPYTLLDTTASIKQLMAMGVESQNVMGTIKALGDVASGVSVPISRIAINYGQVLSLGKLQGRELRDFAMAGVPLLDELAKNMGKTKAEITEMITASQIGFPEVERAFQTMSGEGGKFYNLMEKQNASVTGQISNLTDKWQVMLNAIGKSNEGLIYGGISGLTSLVSNYKDILDVLEGLVVVYGSAKAASVLYSVHESIMAKIDATRATIIAGKVAAIQAEIAAKTELAAAETALAAKEARAVAATLATENMRAAAAAKVIAAKEASAIATAELIAAEKAYAISIAETDAAYSIGAVSEKAIIAQKKELAAVELLRGKAQKANQAANNAITAEIVVNSKIEATAVKLAAGEETAAKELLIKKDQERLIASQAATNAEVAGAAKSKIWTTLTAGANPYMLIAASIAGLFYLLSKLAPVVKTVDEQITDMNKSIESIGKQNETDSLISKYEELEKITGKSTDQQDELNKTIKTLSTLFPEAITGTDQYGKAIGISTEKIIEQNEQLKLNLKLKTEGDLKGQQASLKTLRDQQAKLLDEVNTGRRLDYNGSGFGGLAGASDIVVRESGKLPLYKILLTPEELQKRRAELIDVSTQVDQLAGKVSTVNEELSKMAFVGAESFIKANVDKFKKVTEYTREEAIKTVNELNDLYKGDGSKNDAAIQKQSDDLLAYADKIKTTKEETAKWNAELIQAQKKLKELQDPNYESKTGTPGQEITDQKAVIKDLKEKLGLNKKEKEAVDALKVANEELEKAIKTGNETAIKAAVKRVDELEKQKDLLDGIKESELAIARNRELPRKGATTVSGAIEDMQKATGLDFDPKKQKKYIEDISKLEGKNLDNLQRKQKENADFKEKVDKDEEQRQKDLAQGFFDIADSASSLSQQIGDSNKELAGMLSAIGNIASQMGSLTEKGAFSEKGMSKADAYSSAIGGATQLVGMFISQAAENKRVMEDYYASVIKQQNDYNLSLNEQLRLNTANKGSIFYDDFKAKITDAGKALKDATDKKNKAMAEFYGSEAIVGKKNVVSGGNVLGGVGAGAALGAGIGTLLGGPVIGTAISAFIGGIAGLFAKKKKDIVAPLLETYPLLIKANGDFDASVAKTLIGTQNITKETSDILQNIVDWDAAAKAASDAVTAIITDMAGSIGTDLRNALVDAFEQGTDAAVKFGESVKTVIEDLLSQEIFNAIFGTALAKLQQDMNISAGTGKDEKGNLITGAAVDGNWVDDIQRFYAVVPGLQAVFNSTMADAKAASENQVTTIRQLTAEERQRELDITDRIREAEDALRQYEDAVAQDRIMSSEVELGRLQSDLATVKQEFTDYDKSLNRSTTLDLFGGTTADRAGTAKGIAQASQDSVDELNGRATVIQGHTFRIADGMDILKANSTAILNNVITIKGHTESMQADMKAVKGDMKSVKDGIDTINLKGITLKN